MPEMPPLDRLPRFLDDPDPFLSDEIGHDFYEAARAAVSGDGDVRISTDTLQELQQLHHLSETEVPAYQYLAQLRVRDEQERRN